VPAAAAKAAKAVNAAKSVSASKAVSAAQAPEDLRFPIGRFQRPTGPLTPGERTKYINAIAATPKNMIKAVRGFTGKHFDTPYRPGGWTVRQLVHHVPDSHLNAYIRVKLALTEDAPLIKSYDEDKWAQLSDSKDTPVDVSLSMLTALHDRWVRLLRSLGSAEFARTMTHPDHGPISIDFILALYGWHGAHHVAHITSLRKREGWK
jgi:hypothetical protein